MGDIVAVDHDRCDPVQGLFDARVLSIEFFDECRHASGLERFGELDNELASGN